MGLWSPQDSDDCWKFLGSLFSNYYHHDIFVAMLVVCVSACVPFLSLVPLFDIFFAFISSISIFLNFKDIPAVLKRNILLPFNFLLYFRTSFRCFPLWINNIVNCISNWLIDYFPIPIMQYVLGFLYIKSIQVNYSWDCIMLHGTGYPLF